MRVLGIDFGERRIGLAISDADGVFAMPLRTIERTNDHQAIQEIQEIVRQEEVGRIVIGEPRTSQGERGDAARRVGNFAGKLEESIGIPVARVDEALTTREAATRLREAGLDPRRNPGKLDSVAAQLLLQDALDEGLAE